MTFPVNLSDHDSNKNFPKTPKSSWESLYSGLEIPDEPSHTGEELKLAFEQAPKVFQLLRKFIVTTTRSGLLIIDQQRAHQRVLYEKFLTSITKRNMLSQQLIFPNYPPHFTAKKINRNEPKSA